MINAILLFALSCPQTQIINKTKHWGAHDLQLLKSAQERCGEIFPKEPCLKVFIKQQEHAYRAICGKENKK